MRLIVNGHITINRKIASLNENFVFQLRYKQKFSSYRTRPMAHSPEQGNIKLHNNREHGKIQDRHTRKRLHRSGARLCCSKSFVCVSRPPEQEIAFWKMLWFLFFQIFQRMQMKTMLKAHKSSSHYVSLENNQVIAELERAREKKGQ